LQATGIGKRRIMSDTRKTKAQLLEELGTLRARMAELQRAERERRQAEEALRGSETRLRSVLENSRDIIYRFDIATDNYDYYTPSIQEMTGFTAEELLAMGDEGIVERFHPDDRQKMEGFSKTLDDLPGTDTVGGSTEYRWKHKDGQYRWFSENRSIVRDSDGQPVAVVAAVRDVTKRKQAEEALVKERTILRTLVDNMPDYIFIKDAQSRFITTNTAHLRTLGAETLEEVVGKTDFDFFPKELAEKYHADEQEIVGSGKPLLNRLEMVFRPDGEEQWLLTTKVPLCDASGSVVEIVGISRDITERKQAEQALRESEEKYRELFDTCPDGIAITTLEGEFLDANQSYLDMLGYTLEQLNGMTLRELTPAKWHEAEAESIQSLIPTKGFGTFEKEYIRRDGTVFPVSVTGWIITDAKGNPEKLGAFVKDITERKRAQEALQESEEKYRNLVENSGDVIYALDENAMVTYVSPNIESITGYAPTEVLGKQFTEFVHPEDLPGRLEEFRRSLSGANEPHEYRYVTKSGETIWVRSNPRLVVEEGRVTGLQGVLADITELKQAEERQELIRQVLELLNRSGGETYIIRDLLLLIREFTGFEAVGIRLREGEDFPYYETNGFPPHFVQAERYLCARDATGQLQRDSEGNPVLECMCGNVIVGRTDPSLPFFTEGGSFWTNSTTELLVSTTEEDHQIRTRNRCNAEGYESVALIPLRSDDHIIGLLQLNDRKQGMFTSEMILFLEGIGASIGIALARKQAGDALREQHSFRTGIIERAAEGLCVCHDIPEYPHISFTVWNDRMTEITGYTMEEINHLGWYQTLYPDPETQEKARARMERMRQGDDLHAEEWEITRADGEKRVLTISTSLLETGDGIAHVLALMNDITQHKRAEEERRRLEVQVQQTQKLESLGVLAGGIAHDFNNLLTGILGNADLALLSLSPVSPARDNIEQIESASRRAADLCRQMLAYSGRGQFVVQALDLNEVVREMAHLLEVSISKKIVLKYDLAANLPSVEADVTQMRQVIMNLITNASEAIGDQSGFIAVKTAAIECDEGYLAETYLDQRLPGGLYVSIEISDTGCGMDGETIGKIFDPFFTTKFTGRGLGLAAVLGIVRGHSGALKVYSETGRGTAFRILLPSSDQSAGTAREEPAQVEGWRGEGTLLVVDDEETVRNIAKSMLETFGLTVLTASDGRDAVNTFRERADEIDLVLLDLTMPQMDGEEAFRELRRIKDDVRVILSSGYNEQDVTNRFAGKGLSGFIQKPYQVATLLEKVRGLLET